MTPHDAECGDPLVEQAARQPGLHEIPVTEEHGVGDGTQEGGADDRTQHRHRGGAEPAVGGTDTCRHQTHQADGRRDEVEHGRELGPVVRGRTFGDIAFDAGHLGHPRRPSVELGVGSRHTCLAPHDRHDEHAKCSQRYSEGSGIANRGVAEHHTAREGPGGDEQEGAPQQPAVADAHDATPGGEPAEEQTPDGPLQQKGCGIETNHWRKANDLPMKEYAPDCVGFEDHRDRAQRVGHVGRRSPHRARRSCQSCREGSQSS